MAWGSVLREGERGVKGREGERGGERGRERRGRKSLAHYTQNHQIMVEVKESLPKGDMGRGI